MDERCGTTAGRRVHREAGEEPCDPCKAAAAAYAAERRTCACGRRKRKESAQACPMCLERDWTRDWVVVRGVRRLDPACLPEQLRVPA